MSSRSNGKTLLISIRPKYAEKIFSGTKKVELRRQRPRLTIGQRVLVYVTSPTMELEGTFVVKDVIESTPKRLWNQVRKVAGVSRGEFEKYFEGSRKAVAISIEKPRRLESKVSLSLLRRQVPGFIPPQSFRYLDDMVASKMLSSQDQRNR